MVVQAELANTAAQQVTAERMVVDFKEVFVQLSKDKQTAKEAEMVAEQSQREQIMFNQSLTSKLAGLDAEIQIHLSTQVI